MPRERRSVSGDLSEMDRHLIGLQLVHLLENLQKKLQQIESPLGLHRENPFQSCLDLHDQATSGRSTFEKLSREKRMLIAIRNVLDRSKPWQCIRCDRSAMHHRKWYKEDMSSAVESTYEGA
jgi:hypothetical protein